VTGLCEVAFVHSVKQHGLITCREPRVQGARKCWGRFGGRVSVNEVRIRGGRRRVRHQGLQRWQVEQSDPHLRLLRKVAPEVGLMHGRHRMPAHVGMAVDAVNKVAGAGEKVAENDVATQVRGRYGDGDEGGFQDAAADLHGAADRADLG
jgi:hypothetical protein